MKAVTPHGLVHPGDHDIHRQYVAGHQVAWCRTHATAHDAAPRPPRLQDCGHPVTRLWYRAGERVWSCVDCLLGTQDVA